MNCSVPLSVCREPITGIADCCARRERPRNRRAAEQGDELAAFHSITSSAATCSRLGLGGRGGSDTCSGTQDSAAYDLPASSRNEITASKSLRRFFSMMMPWAPSANITNRLPGEFTNRGNRVCAM
jgi:hypothetical protein